VTQNLDLHPWEKYLDTQNIQHLAGQKRLKVLMWTNPQNPKPRTSQTRMQEIYASVTEKLIN